MTTHPDLTVFLSGVLYGAAGAAGVSRLLWPRPATLDPIICDRCGRPHTSVTWHWLHCDGKPKTIRVGVGGA